MNAPFSPPLPACKRCGRCCESGGPALHVEDLTLVAAGVIARAHLVTLRAGELAHENVAGKLAPLDRELVKIAGVQGLYACQFHDATARACRIHENRPAECRALSCEDTSRITDMYREDRLTRADLVGTGGGLWELIAFHDQAFAAGAAMNLAREASRGGRVALHTLRELARSEDSFRQSFQLKTGISPEELDFYFGRSLARICSPFGVTFP